jgi:hypothetical protein
MILDQHKSPVRRPPENGFGNGMKMPFALLVTILGLAVLPAQAEEQGWRVVHESFGNGARMAAFADADSGPGRINLYCDTRDGFRIQLSPGRHVMEDGPGRIAFTIDGAAPILLGAIALGEETTELVSVYGSGAAEAAFAHAHHVDVTFIGYSGIGYSGTRTKEAFTFKNLGDEATTLLKVCPPDTRR